jgi:hypothetical protein
MTTRLQGHDQLTRCIATSRPGIGGRAGTVDATCEVMAATYPVHYMVERPERFTRLQLLIRILVFCVLGVIGISFGLAFMVGFVALPVFAAARLTSRGDKPHAYVAEDGPLVISALRWFAAVSAWVGLVADELPRRSPEETVRIDVEASANPTPTSALLRLITGLPSAFVLAVLGWLGVFVWLWAALSILFTERVGSHAFNYLIGLQRWSIRLLAYQASLVDEYPPFSFTDSPGVMPTARAVV